MRQYQIILVGLFLIVLVSGVIYKVNSHRRSGVSRIIGQKYLYQSSSRISIDDHVTAIVSHGVLAPRGFTSTPPQLVPIYGYVVYLHHPSIDSTSSSSQLEVDDLHYKEIVELGGGKVTLNHQFAKGVLFINGKEFYLKHGRMFCVQIGKSWNIESVRQMNVYLPPKKSPQQIFKELLPCGRK